MYQGSLIDRAASNILFITMIPPLKGVLKSSRGYINIKLLPTQLGKEPNELSQVCAIEMRINNKPFCNRVPELQFLEPGFLQPVTELFPATLLQAASFRFQEYFLFDLLFVFIVFIV